MSRRARVRGITILDRVYEHVAFPPIITSALDTPAVQRLRSLQQLGASCFLYPGAVHTRFEHSVGVAHLARTLLQNFQTTQPDLGIAEDDITVAMLAGLLHDVGHGPFSHLFEDVVAQRCGIHFNHEEMSEHIARRVLRPLIPGDQVELVVGLMRGSSSLPYGEIISNKRSGVDVDRIDYFIRDSMCCYGKPANVRPNRLFSSARLVCADGQWQVAFQQKMALTLRELFTLRATLHKNVYQHQVTKAIGHMIGDILFLAAPHYRIGGHTLTECAADVELFGRLGDWILDGIAASEAPELQPARALIRRLRCRDLYRTTFCSALNLDHAEALRGIDWHAQVMAHSCPSLPVPADSFVTEVAVINQGKGQRDPLEEVRFFNPKRPSQPIQQLSSETSSSSPLFTPLRFEERTLMVFEKHDTKGALQRACERIRADPAMAHYFADSIPFYNAI